MLSTEKIIAYTRQGNQLVILNQADSAYFLTFARVSQSWLGSKFTVLAKKTLTKEEALLVWAKMTGATAQTGQSSMLLQAPGASAENQEAFIPEMLLLEAPKQALVSDSKKDEPQSIPSPYFPLAQIILTQQSPRAPNL